MTVDLRIYSKKCLKKNLIIKSVDEEVELLLGKMTRRDNDTELLQNVDGGSTFEKKQNDVKRK